MKNLIEKYKRMLKFILEKHGTEEIMKITDAQERTTARQYRNFIEDLEEQIMIEESRRGGIVM